ncbi:hypothetical protein GS466_08975 [Rhodococcus hoagii]|nr:hypothetical protein [Prescottella equi]
MTDPIPMLDSLIRDPLFQLSLPDQDAFHSNMLSWLIRMHPAAAYPLSEITDALLGSIVKRDWHGLDLFVDEDMGSHKLALINRVHSLPTADRLDAIAGNVRWPITVHLMLSLVTPHEPVPEPWLHVDYSQLIRPLRESVKILRASDDSSSADIVGAYAVLIERLVSARESIEQALSRDAPLYFDAIPYDAATRSGVNSLAEKLRINLLAEHVSRHAGQAVAVDLSSQYGSAQLLFATRTGHQLGWRSWKNEIQRVVALEDTIPSRWRGQRGERESYVKQHFADFFVSAPRMLDQFLDPPVQMAGGKSREPNVVFDPWRGRFGAPPSAYTAACAALTDYARRFAEDSAV